MKLKHSPVSLLKRWCHYSVLLKNWRVFCKIHTCHMTKQITLTIVVIYQGVFVVQISTSYYGRILKNKEERVCVCVCVCVCVYLYTFVCLVTHPLTFWNKLRKEFRYKIGFSHISLVSQFRVILTLQSYDRDIIKCNHKVRGT